jgi:hypothetical protein
VGRSEEGVCGRVNGVWGGQWRWMGILDNSDPEPEKHRLSQLRQKQGVSYYRFRERNPGMISFQ